MAFHGFGTATRMLSPTYWHVQTYFRPSTGGIQKHGALLPHSWIQEAPLKGLEGGDFGIYIGKNTIASNGRRASKARGTTPSLELANPEIGGQLNVNGTVYKQNLVTENQLPGKEHPPSREGLGVQSLSIWEPLICKS